NADPERGAVGIELLEIELDPLDVLCARQGLLERGSDPVPARRRPPVDESPELRPRPEPVLTRQLVLRVGEQEPLVWALACLPPAANALLRELAVVPEIARCLRLVHDDPPSRGPRPQRRAREVVVESADEPRGG